MTTQTTKRHHASNCPSRFGENCDCYPPRSCLDRYKKHENIEFCEQWCDIAEEKIARLRALCRSGSMTAKEALYFSGVFGNYVNLLPRPVVTSHPMLCSSCGENFADTPNKLCPGCDAYKEHTS